MSYTCSPEIHFNVIDFYVIVWSCIVGASDITSLDSTTDILLSANPIPHVTPTPKPKRHHQSLRNRTNIPQGGS